MYGYSVTTRIYSARMYGYAVSLEEIWILSEYPDISETAPLKKETERETERERERRTRRHQDKRMVLSPFLTGRMFVRPNILRTLRRTMIRFLIELLVRRIWFGQSKLYFILNWLVMRCKLRPELAAAAQQTA